MNREQIVNKVRQLGRIISRIIKYMEWRALMREHHVHRGQIQGQK